MSTKSALSVQLKVQRLIKAPIARVFTAWTTPSDLVKWFGPGDWKVSAADVDPRSGGSYRITFHSDNEAHDVTVSGVYREIKAPTKLVFTWKSEGMNIGETLVTVDLKDADGSTEVIVRHEGFPADPVRDRHAHGWQLCMDNLEVLFGPADKK
ncbi:MAG TPA: SRPBCC domain-containing protein [Opitutaceae bacterium]|nr:SRPBCC domain-containing protein [Opitutaceae bacterium]